MMKKLKPEDLFQHLNGFLKDKGVELAGSKRISQSLRRSCEKITQSINTANQAIRFAKKQVEAKLDQMRDAIHLKTTPPNTNNTPKKTKHESQEESSQKTRQEGGQKSCS
jgi:DNA-binding transcriptional MerR regulator